MSRPQATAAPGYVHVASGFDEELARLHLLQERYDARTFARLTALGPLAGAVCLEVGAGAGSVARWLAGQAGPFGHVVATGADPRFLAGTQAAGVKVRRHDILADPLKPARYDIVHCRALRGTGGLGWDGFPPTKFSQSDWSGAQRRSKSAARRVARSRRSPR